MNTTEFHKQFEAIADEFCDKAREALLEGPGTVTRESLLGQIIMEEMFAHPCDPESDGDPTDLTTEVKASLVRVASHMGPDYCQALYHAAVFMTKVV